MNVTEERQNLTKTKMQETTPVEKNYVVLSYGSTGKAKRLEMQFNLSYILL